MVEIYQILFHSNVVDGATIFAIKVKDASRFGVVEFDFQKNILSLEEKPKFPKSDYAVTGIYKYDATVFDYVQDLKPSKRGELEITDLNNILLKIKKLKMEILKKRFSLVLTQGPLKVFLKHLHL